MEEAGVQQLLEIADDAQVDQLLDIVLLALAQLLTLQPAGGQHASGCELCVSSWHHHLPKKVIYAAPQM